MGREAFTSEERAELALAQRLADHLDGVGEGAEGADERDLLALAGLVQALGPGSEDVAGIDEVGERLRRSSRRGDRRPLAALGLAAGFTLLVLLPGQGPSRPAPELAAIEWPRLRPRPSPSKLHRRGRLRVSRLVRRDFDRRKPWSMRSAPDT